MKSRLARWRERANIEAETFAALIDMTVAEFLRCEGMRHSMHDPEREALRWLFGDQFSASYLLAVPQNDDRATMDKMDAAFRQVMLLWTHA